MFKIIDTIKICSYEIYAHREIYALCAEL